LRIPRSSRIVKITINNPKAMLVAVIRAPLLDEFCIDQAGQARMATDEWANGRALHSLKSLRWENFRWTGLGQKT
jgi:hypothetical protein